MAFQQGHPDHPSPSRLHGVSADNVVGAPVGAFDQDIGLDPLDDLCGRVVVKNRDGVNTLERQQDLGAFGLGRNWALRSFVGADRSIRVEADDQRVAKRPRIPQISHMAGMQEIEYAVGEDDGSSSRLNLLSEARG